MRILIIEDEPGILNFLRQGLEEESYSVDTATNGLNGLEMALAEAYDVVLIDWMLPGKSGVEVCREVRKAGVKTPIIFLTARVRSRIRYSACRPAPMTTSKNHSALKNF